ncbi:helix-turn-helix domain-containing protein [Rathayibacter sp. CAU 1779]
MVVEVRDLLGREVIVALSQHRRLVQQGHEIPFVTTTLEGVFSEMFRPLRRIFRKATHVQSHPEPQQHGNSFGFSAWRGPSTVMAAPHAHNDIEINYCTQRLVYRSGGKASILPAGIPCAFWGAKPHQLVELAEGSPLAFVTVPLQQFMAWTAIPLATKLRLLQGDILIAHDGTTGIEAGPAIERWADDLAQAGGQRRRAAELEIEALLSRMAAGTWARTEADQSPTATDLRRAASMAAFIAENATNRIQLADIAACVHLHPNRASALFRRVFGVGASHYLAQFRVAEAQRLLLTTDLTSAVIARRSGFQSVSTYHETFVDICQIPPLTWKRQNSAAADR